VLDVGDVGGPAFLAGLSVTRFARRYSTVLVTVA
jgi:hypothetical protein